MTTKRRGWLLRAAGAVLATALAGGTAPATAGAVGAAPARVAGPAAVRPNVLLVKTDDQVLDSMDRLAQYMPWTAAWFAQGRAFTQAVVANPSCCQSRATTFVGRYPHNHKVWSQGSASVLDSRGGIAPYLSRAGYRTGIVGKFLNLVWTSPPGYQDWTTTHGDSAGEADPSTGVVAPTWYWNFHATDATGDTIVPDYATTWTGNRLREYLSGYLADPGTPWFVEWDPVAPHTHDNLSQMVEPRYAKVPVPGCTVPDEPDVSDKPPYVRAFDVARSTSQNICRAAQRTLRSVDDELRATITLLDKAGRLPNTLVILTSDNGLMNGEHDGMSRKYVPYEPSVRVPLFLRWDGVVTPGVDDRLTTNTDLLPTILDAAGITPRADLPAPDGVSLLPGSGPRPAAAPPDLQLLEYRLDPGWTPARPAPIPTWAALRTARWKYVETYAEKAGLTVAFREYYDLVADPGELVNLLADRDPGNDPPVAALSATLARMRACAGATCLRPLPVPVLAPPAVDGTGTLTVTATALPGAQLSVTVSGAAQPFPAQTGVDPAGAASVAVDVSTVPAGTVLTVTGVVTDVTGASSRVSAPVTVTMPEPPPPPPPPVDPGA